MGEAKRRQVFRAPLPPGILLILPSSESTVYFLDFLDGVCQISLNALPNVFLRATCYNGPFVLWKFVSGLTISRGDPLMRTQNEDMRTQGMSEDLRGKN